MIIKNKNLTLELTEDEFRWVLAKRKEEEIQKEKDRKKEEAREMIIKGFQLLIENGGTMSLEGGAYVSSGQNIKQVIKTNRGIRCIER